MAPQLIQSLQLLQMSSLELELEIQQQMEINPLLEESLDTEEDGDEEDGVEEGLEEEAELPGDSEEVNFDALLEDSFDRNSYNNETSEYDPDWEQGPGAAGKPDYHADPAARSAARAVDGQRAGRPRRRDRRVHHRQHRTTAAISPARLPRSPRRFRCPSRRSSASSRWVQGFDPPGIGRAGPAGVPSDSAAAARG